MTTNDTGAGEKRDYPRVNRLFFISYVTTEESIQKTPVSMGRTLDISPTGVGIEVYKELAVGSVMEMEIDLENFELPVRGTIVRVNAMDNGDYIIGVQFDELQELLPTQANPD